MGLDIGLTAEQRLQDTVKGRRHSSLVHGVTFSQLVKGFIDISVVFSNHGVEEVVWESKGIDKGHSIGTNRSQKRSQRLAKHTSLYGGHETTL